MSSGRPLFDAAGRARFRQYLEIARQRAQNEELEDEEMTDLDGGENEDDDREGQVYDEEMEWLRDNLSPEDYSTALSIRNLRGESAREDYENYQNGHGRYEGLHSPVFGEWLEWTNRDYPPAERFRLTVESLRTTIAGQRDQGLEQVRQIAIATLDTLVRVEGRLNEGLPPFAHEHDADRAQLAVAEAEVRQVLESADEDLSVQGPPGTDAVLAWRLIYALRILLTNIPRAVWFLENHD